jgi:uncharacterized protein YkwD
VHFSLVDPVLIVGTALLVVHAIRGHGFVPYLTELVAFAAGLTLALAWFGPMGTFIHTRLGVNQGVASFGSFLLVLVLVHAAVQAPVSRGAAWIWSQVRYLPPNTLAVVDAAPAVGVAAMLATLLLCVAAVLPVASALHPQLSGSLLGSQILGHSGFVETPVQRLLSPPSTGPKPLLESDPASNPGEDAFYKLQFPADLAIQPDPAAETKMLQLVNQARAQVSLSPLRGDSLLQQVARAHSADMYQRHYFSHNTPDGKTPYDRMSAQRFHYVTAGENIAFAPDVNQAFSSLMNSPDHKANILNPDFRCIGIGAYQGLNGYEEMFTQDFADCS